jgi:hypothetical protein
MAYNLLTTTEKARSSPADSSTNDLTQWKKHTRRKLTSYTNDQTKKSVVALLQKLKLPIMSSAPERHSGARLAGNTAPILKLIFTFFHKTSSPIQEKSLSLSLSLFLCCVS